MSLKYAPAVAPESATNHLLSKKDLCCYYNLINPQGNCNYDALYNLVLTDEVIQQMGLTVEQVRCRGKKIFTATETLRLKDILRIP